MAQHKHQHHREDAAQHLTAAVQRARPEDSIGAVRQALLGRELEDTEIVCVVDENDKLLGLLSFADLFRLPAEMTMTEAMRTSPAVLASEDQEKVASIALHFGLNSVPVVDNGRRLLGVVPVKALLHILRHEHIEDIHRFAGIRHEASVARRALDTPPIRRVRDRLPWLVVGLFGSMLTTLIMSRFEASLHEKVALAFFVPGLVYLAGAIGAQAVAIAVRGLSLAHVGIGRILLTELRTGLMIGLALGGIALPIVLIFFTELKLALVVAGTLVLASGAVTTTGMLLPWLLMRLKRDPAYGSGPLATVIQDVITLLIYFAMVILVYGH